MFFRCPNLVFVKVIRHLSLLAILVSSVSIKAQEIIQLPFESIKNVTWENPERQFYSTSWETEVVTNVAKPSMEVFRPTDQNVGTALIVAPGGGLYGLSINSEGNHVAKWLNAKGVTVFVLRYRLVPTGEDGSKEINELFESNPDEMYRQVDKVLPFSIQDGLNAIKYVRENATQYDINPDRIGFMGFSAGGAVTMGVGYSYDDESRPNFLIPVYPWTDVIAVEKPRADVPPTLIICATDDPLGLASGSTQLYTSLFENKKNVALHMYARGGHGFGMKKQGLPSDKWIERFYDWATSEQLISQ